MKKLSVAENNYYNTSNMTYWETSIRFVHHINLNVYFQCHKIHRTMVSTFKYGLVWVSLGDVIKVKTKLIINGAINSYFYIDTDYTFKFLVQNLCMFLY